jgi:hypothetical protein
MKDYSESKEMKKSSSYSGNCGEVKEHSEYSVEMTRTGSQKYSHNNPAEMKNKTDALAKMRK